MANTCTFQRNPATGAWEVTQDNCGGAKGPCPAAPMSPAASSILDAQLTALIEGHADESDVKAAIASGPLVIECLESAAPATVKRLRLPVAAGAFVFRCTRNAQSGEFNVINFDGKE